MLSNFVELMQTIKTDIVYIANILLTSLEASKDKLNNHILRTQEIELELELHKIKYLNNTIDQNVVVAIALHSPEAINLRLLIAYIKATHELMHIAQYVDKYLKSITDLKFDNENAKDDFKKFAIELTDISISSIKLVIQMLCDLTIESIDQEQINENVSHQIYQQFKKYIDTNNDDVLKYQKLRKTIKRHEQILNCCHNIIDLLLYAKNGGSVPNIN